MSREDQAFNRGAIKGVGPGMVAALKNFAEFLWNLATDPAATIDGIAESLENIDEVPGLLAAYLEELDGMDPEQQGEEIAKLIADQVFTFAAPPSKVKLLQQASKAKLGAAAVKVGKRTSKIKAIASFEKLIFEHETKLAEYIKNPMKFDNKGFLKNAPSEKVRQQIIQSRIKHLQQEIQTFKDNIQKIVKS